ncbi:MAG TPA: hypothetical protein PKK11_05180 [Methanothrix sp.]|nr:hypothetical protein [Methanothrix sp.]
MEIPPTQTLVRALKACENLTGEKIEAVEMVAKKHLLDLVRKKVKLIVE